MHIHANLSYRIWRALLSLCIVVVSGLLVDCGSSSNAPAATASSDGSGLSSGVVGTFPRVNDAVYAMVPDGMGGVYIGGRFSQVGSLSRQSLAHITTGGLVDPLWDPKPDGPVTALLLQNRTLYIGGNFFSVNGVERWRLASVEEGTGVLTPWNPRLGSANLVNALTSLGPIIYVGGVFELINAVVSPTTGLGGEARRNLAAVDAGSGLATSWNPNIFEGEVMTLRAGETAVYVGGSFDRVGLVGQDTIRENLAAFDLGSGVASQWHPAVRGIDGDVVSALTISGSVVYVGGRFREIGGQPRNNLAAVDIATGVPSTWNLPTDDAVSTFFDDGRRLYIGGFFTTIGGVPRGRLAAVDKTTGQLTAWNPDADGWVRSIVVSDGKVFVAGDFTTIGGRPQSTFAVLDADSGLIVGLD